MKINETLPTYNEGRRCLYWHSYFVALRRRDQVAADTWRDLAQAQEKAKRLALADSKQEARAAEAALA